MTPTSICVLMYLYCRAVSWSTNVPVKRWTTQCDKAMCNILQHGAAPPQARDQGKYCSGALANEKYENIKKSAEILYGLYRILYSLFCSVPNFSFDSLCRNVYEIILTCHPFLPRCPKMHQSSIGPASVDLNLSKVSRHQLRTPSWKEFYGFVPQKYSKKSFGMSKNESCILLLKFSMHQPF